MTLDLSGALRRALVDDAAIAGGLSVWHREPAVFTRRPVPADAQQPLAIVNPPASISDEDALNSERPVITRDIAFYGTKAEPGSAADQTRVVEALAYRARKLFHRRKFSVRPDGYSVIDIRAAGPFVGPVDDDGTIGRLVRLTIRLRGS